MSTPPPFKPLDFALEAFSPDDAATIILAVNSVDAGAVADARTHSVDLARNLNSLAVAYAADDYQGDLPPATELHPRLERISGMCAKLIKALGADGAGVAHDLGPRVLWKSAKLRGAESGEAAVTEAVRGLLKLQEWSEFAANLLAVELAARPPKKGKRPDEALGGLVRGLAETFEWLWIKEAGRSTDRISGEPGGRFFVLVTHVLERLAPHQFTPYGIDGLIRRSLHKDEKS